MYVYNPQKKKKKKSSGSRLFERNSKEFSSKEADGVGQV